MGGGWRGKKLSDGLLLVASTDARLVRGWLAVVYLRKGF